MNGNEYDFQNKVINELSAIEMAYEIFMQSKKTFNFKELANSIASLKELPIERVTDLYSQLYTQINIDGRFIHLGSNEWGLKNWYPIGKAEEVLESTEYIEDTIIDETIDSEDNENFEAEETEDDIDFLDDEEEKEDEGFEEDEEDEDFEEEEMEDE